MREKVTREREKGHWPRAPEPPLLEALFVGIDISQDHVDVAVVDHRGNLVKAATRYSNSGKGHAELWKDTQELGERMSLPMAYAMEATGVYHLNLLTYLLGKKARVWSFNPLLLQGERQGKVRKTKTDKLDAELIAGFARKSGALHPYAAPDPDRVCLREYCRSRFRIVQKASDTKRHLRRDLDALCPGFSAEFSDIGSPMAKAVLKAFAQITHPFAATVETVKEVLRPFYADAERRTLKATAIQRRFEERKGAGGVEEPMIWELKALLHQLELFEEQLRQVEGRIEREMEKRKSVVATIPGIGHVTAAVIEGELGDPHRFECAEKVVAFAGLDPTVYASGKFEGNQRHISKRGSPLLREALYNSALAASRVNPACKELYERKLAKGKTHRSALVAVSAKLLVQAWAVMREGKSFELPEKYRPPTEVPKKTEEQIPETPREGKENNAQKRARRAPSAPSFQEKNMEKSGPT